MFFLKNPNYFSYQILFERYPYAKGQFLDKVRALISGNTVLN